MLGPDAEFRPDQFEAIEAVVEHRKRVLVVQATGWGKSIVYFIATRLLRDDGLGPTLLISPLLALMRDQILMAERIGVRALTINSANTDEWGEVERQLKSRGCDILLVSPERLANPHFLDETLLPALGDFGLLVVDEAHCISDWGHDFRPDYRRIKRIVNLLPTGVPVLATTATANDRVVEDIESQLGPGLETVRGPLARASLQLQAIPLADQAERLAWVAKYVPGLPRSGVIYCLTVADTFRVARWLKSRGINAEAYNADLASDVREKLEERLRTNDVKALVATVALGMGFDKPDLGFVIHFQRPGSIVAYYQQVGRAGRALDDAYAILLSGSEDDDIQQYFISNAFPPYQQLADIIELLEGADEGLSIPEIEIELNLKRSQVEKAFKILEVDQAVAHKGSKYSRTANPFVYDAERVAEVTARRLRELEQMQRFVTLDSCLMEYVTQALDDPGAAPCGRCAVCRGGLLGVEVDQEVVREAVEFLRKSPVEIQPRARVPFNVAFDGKTNIPPDWRVETGVALCMYNDAGWGREVRRCKYGAGHFSEPLVKASAALIASRWDVDPATWWVTAVPSLRTPELVPDFAERLATLLGLPYVAALTKIVDTPVQKEKMNSAQQAANVAFAFRADDSLVKEGPVVLVDDMVDSRWTVTFCGVRLRQAGSGPVHPFALANAQGSDGRKPALAGSSRRGSSK
jgi:ATP-dependent DNA helicase RecQ